jgi:diaminohydroxyphosphoribosylaminopyrimidine deaminase/5-amino-6-(5-phosphoribosylamino)uracil reductase
MPAEDHVTTCSLGARGYSFYVSTPPDDKYFMRAALREARRSLGRTSPNPAVGAVLVVQNQIVARGHHRRAGLPHAEVDCLRNFGRAIPNSAILYVTLEPCSTVGRTPACTDEIIRSGVKTVVIGSTDVNPRHSGRGLELLRNAGIEVRANILVAECSALNEAFNKWTVTGQPFVIAKCGMSLDGRLVRPATESRWITSAAARWHAHKLRSQVDAILVGAETVRIDNPRLTVRGVGDSVQPLRVVVTRSGNLPRRARIFTDRFANKTLVYQRKSLNFVLRDLGQRNVTSVLIEGGGNVLGQALDERKIDKVHVYLGPIFTGGSTIAFAGRGASLPRNGAYLERTQYQRLDHDLCISGYPTYRSDAAAE